jgi:type I restriction-modification system DNA methylase subunit
VAEAGGSSKCPPRILELVETFRQNLASYKAGNYKEAQVRQEFLDPFFAELGWDMDNRQGYAETYKEVIHEDAISISGTTKAPDYCFRIGGTRKFFVEAKKPAVNLLEDQEAAYQLRRYGWSAKLPLCILTDFEHLAVYDTRVPPKPGDSAATARVRVIGFEEYARRWDSIAVTFSKESVLKGRFDVEAAKKDKRGTAEVDSLFLEEIESWRKELARNLKLRNQDLNQQELNHAVQATIDRIIFLRICEDRGIEPQGRLQSCAKNPNVYVGLLDLFRQADEKYNSGLFHFQNEKGRNSAVDTLTPRLALDDKVLRQIIGRLYYPESPYEFSILPAEVLGQVYEQFLGSVIVVTEKRADVVQKPEVRNAGGVFYTPSYIVDHIVKSTIGQALKGKTPDQASDLRIVDPACGSGSFLLGAYQFLLDWHLEQYRKSPKKWKDRIAHVGEGAWTLASAERCRILLNNIFGVDIDGQAVEVTKLSLLLKVLEKTPGEVLDKQLKLTHKRALPDLDSNIKCGNTLLDYRHLGQTLLDDETRRRVNPFDWKTEFPAVFAKGGFDAVIGNPPYIRVQTMTEWAPLEVELYKQHYKAASKGNYDIYVCFLERGLWLLNPTGRLGYILPHKFFNAQYGEPVRGLIATGKHLAGVIHFGDQQVFDNATTYTCLLFLDKAGAAQFDFVRVPNLTEWRLEGKATTGTIPAAKVGAADWNFNVGEGSGLFDKLGNMPTKLGDVAHLFVGLQTDADDVFILEQVRRDGKRVLCKSKATDREHWFEEDHLKHFLKGSVNIRRYHLSDVTKRLIFPYESKGGKSVLMDQADYERRFPLTWVYLLENRERLAERNKGQMGKDWQGYVYKKNHERLGTPKLLVPSLGTGAAFAADLEGRYFFAGSGGGGGGGYGIAPLPDFAESPLCLLALLNSRLLSHFLRSISTPFRGGYLALNKQVIEQLPIRRLDLANAADKATHDKLASLAGQILDLYKRRDAARVDQERTSFQRQIDATDAEIDRLVYGIYGITADEIQQVESRPKV